MKARPIRLTQEEYNRLCSIEDSAAHLYDFLNGVGKPDWPAHRDDPGQEHSVALYHHTLLRNLLNKE